MDIGQHFKKLKGPLGKLVQLRNILPIFNGCCSPTFNAGDVFLEKTPQNYNFVEKT